MEGYGDSEDKRPAAILFVLCVQRALTGLEQQLQPFLDGSLKELESQVWR